MKTIKLNLIFMFLAGMTLSQPAFSITLSSGHFGEVVVNWGNQIVPYSNVGESSLIGSSSKITLVSPNISVTGNLYLDYSVFSENSGLFTSGLVSLSGQGVNIFPSFISPVLPDLANLTAYNSVPDSYSGIGDTLFFGNPAITNGNFTATKNIYIADYSSLSGLAISSVPVPAAFWFFISGLSILMGGKFRKQFF